MDDPRLNSIHLPGPRREQFRQARHALLEACGEYTLFGQVPEDSGDRGSHTIIQLPEGKSPNLDCWLADGDCVYPLKVGVNTVGRSSENDIVVQDAYISRRQCAIVVHRDANCEIHDTASKNGTLLNGQKLDRPIPLRPGDQITLNDHKFVFMARGFRPSKPDNHATLAG